MNQCNITKEDIVQADLEELKKLFFFLQVKCM